MYTKLNPGSWRGNSAVDHGVEAVDVGAGGGAGVVEQEDPVEAVDVVADLWWLVTDFKTRRLGPFPR